MRPIQIRRRHKRDALLTFSTVTDAIIWKWRQDLDADFLIEDTRPEDSPDRIAEMPLIAGTLIRDALMPCWRSEQYDRLIEGRIDRFPDRVGTGLEKATAVATMLCLLEAGAPGWNAMSGRFHNPVRGPIISRQNTPAPVAHAWCQSASGILDLSGKIFDRMPMAFLVPEDDRHGDFLDASPIIDDPEAVTLAATWTTRIAGHLVPALRQAGVARMSSPQHQEVAEIPHPGF